MLCSVQVILGTRNKESNNIDYTITKKTAITMMLMFDSIKSITYNDSSSQKKRSKSHRHCRGGRCRGRFRFETRTPRTLRDHTIAARGNLAWFNRFLSLLPLPMQPMMAAHRLVSSTASRKLFSTSASTASNIFNKITFIGGYQ
jgi:hypothetical protein